MTKNLFNLITKRHESVQWPPQSATDMLPYIPARQHKQYMKYIADGIGSIEQCMLEAIEAELFDRGIN